MNLDDVLNDTRQAYIDAGAEDPDLAYITQAYLDDLERNAEEVTDSGDQSSEGEEAAQWGSLYFDVTFSGLRFYGTFGGERYVCDGNWRRTGAWNQRAIVGRCNNRNSIIWRIG